MGVNETILIWERFLNQFFKLWTRIFKSPKRKAPLHSAPVHQVAREPPFQIKQHGVLGSVFLSLANNFLKKVNKFKLEWGFHGGKLVKPGVKCSVVQ